MNVGSKQLRQRTTVDMGVTEAMAVKGAKLNAIKGMPYSLDVALEESCIIGSNIKATASEIKGLLVPSIFKFFKVGDLCGRTISDSHRQ